jgi:ribose transport system substrate-binding protein
MIYSRAGMTDMLKTRWVVVAAGALAVISMSGCGPAAHEPTEKYFLVAANIKLPYWQTVVSGLNRAASEMKVKAELAGPDTYDPQGEHNEFRRAVAQKPAGIMVSAADAGVLAPDIDAALGQGIPVITVDSDAPNSKRLLFVGTDNFNAGSLGGQLVAKLLNGKGTVAIFTMMPQANLKERLQGYQSIFTGHPGIKVSEIVDIKGDAPTAFDNARRILESKNKVDAIVCLEAIACPEVGEVVNRENMAGKVTIIAMDTDQRTLDWIQKGVISATIAQKPFTMGYYGCKVLDDLHHHRPNPLTANWGQNPFSPIPTFVDTGTSMIDKGNLDAFKQQQQSAGNPGTPQ